MKFRHFWRSLAVLALLLTGIVVRASVLSEENEICNWPQFHGPRRDNLSEDIDLLKRWPEAGPELIWRATGIGHGFSSVAIADGMIYTSGNIEGDTVIRSYRRVVRSVHQERSRRLSLNVLIRRIVLHHPFCRVLAE